MKLGLEGNPLDFPYGQLPFCDSMSKKRGSRRTIAVPESRQGQNYSAFKESVGPLGILYTVITWNLFPWLKMDVGRVRPNEWKT